MWNDALLNEIFASVLPALKGEITALNDFMAQNPELGSEEYQASAKIVELLRAHGLTVEYPFGGLPTAFKATINPGQTKRFALMVEYDALPDIGHGCGHCASGMASVMAGLAFHKVRDQIDAQVDIIGTPDEEMTGGKCTLVSQGLFDGYDFAAMVHMGGETLVDVSFIALDGMTFQFRGAPAHAAQNPQLGRNALNAVRLLFDSVDMMRQHVIPEARIHGYIKNGGVASNIVPDYTEAEFLTRAPKRQDLDDITAWVQDCARAAALATRTELTIQQLGEPFHELWIAPLSRAVMEECLQELGHTLFRPEGQYSGSSDVGNVDYVCPAFQPLMSIGQRLEVHTREFAEAMTDARTHEAIEAAARFLIKLAFKLYNDPDRLAALKKAHREYRGL